MALVVGRARDLDVELGVNGGCLCGERMDGIVLKLLLPFRS